MNKWGSRLRLVTLPKNSSDSDRCHGLDENLDLRRPRTWLKEGRAALKTMPARPQGIAPSVTRASNAVPGFPHNRESLHARRPGSEPKAQKFLLDEPRIAFGDPLGERDLRKKGEVDNRKACLLYTSDAADE